jgi:hypothetical protein
MVDRPGEHRADPLLWLDPVRSVFLQDARLHELEKSFQETKLKAEDWKEYSNMQRFKAEVLVDMVRAATQCASFRCNPLHSL